MPQLDLVTFLPQYFWLLVTFFSFYYFIAKYFLPKISRIYILRDVLIKNNAETKQNLSNTENLEQVFLDSKNLYSKASEIGKEFTSEFLTEFPAWCNKSVNDLSEKNQDLASYYNQYIQAIADITLSREISYVILNKIELNNKLSDNLVNYNILSNYFDNNRLFI
uniref:ATP synthase F0 subunit 8 n=1 Tax=Helicosporidium sp. subsp. Simulium jonesii TaxID=145475 RepID=D3IZX5_HELSJ|nr:ATP synthase F0 subunit 8 [Helicosporidium sp. ex Simulium jonesi]ACT36202.1 ATP synthase F0 subunit 8 [Helicosporidium sp. ex Simulium jonesi]